MMMNLLLHFTAHAYLFESVPVQDYKGLHDFKNKNTCFIGCSLFLIHRMEWFESLVKLGCSQTALELNEIMKFNREYVQKKPMVSLSS